MKIVRLLLIIVSVVVLLFIAFVGVLCVTLSPRHTFRCLLWGESDIKDYEKFPARKISNEPPVFFFKKNLRESLSGALSDVRYLRDGREKQIGNLDDFLRSTETTAFIVIKDDEILYEKYFNGYTRDSINTSFSMAKSFDSALIGIAIDEGLIKSVEEPITNYLPELKDKRFEKITIRHLLTMASGIKYHENGLPWGDDALTYYFPNLRKLALGVKIQGPPGLHFQYNNFNPLLIGMILERATGNTVSHYLQEKIWKPLGMEYPATWSLDSKKTGFEKMESGLNARSIDFAKFGRLFLNKGNWNGKQIISEKWVVESTSPVAVDRQKYYDPKYDPQDAFRIADNGYYAYFWWGRERDAAHHDFYAAGNHGQYIYVCPQKNVILVRNGKESVIDNWHTVFYEMANRI